MAAEIYKQLNRYRHDRETGSDDDERKECSSGGTRRRRAADPNSSRIKRALFGPVDHEENIRFVRQELARGRLEASKRWNYDFENDRPEAGRYEWESVRKANEEEHLSDDASRVEKSCNQISNPLNDTCDNPPLQCVSNEASVSPTKRSVILKSSDNPFPRTESTSIAQSCSTRGQRNKQTSITDHFRHRKQGDMSTKSSDSPESSDVSLSKS